MEIPNHRARVVGVAVQQRINALGIGQKMQDLPEELWHPSFRYYVKEDPTRQGGPNLRMIRLDPDQPSLTVTGYIFNKFVHPFENRFITPREAARLQGFPDDYEFFGNLTSIQQQIGDAVPIELGEVLFSHLLKFVGDLHPEVLGLPALGLFSGAGGLELSARRSYDLHGRHWQTVASVEVDHDRCNTLRNNFGDTLPVLQQDIRQLTAHKILETAQTRKEELWLVYGGPPCQSFSQAGKQKGTSDSRGNLIFEYLRIVDEIRPPLFLLENVANLKGIEKGSLLQTILEDMRRMGYRVDYRVLNSAHYGNAQKRRRIIFLGTHRSIPKMVHLPEPTHSEHGDIFGMPRFKTVREALAGLPNLQNSTVRETTEFP